MIFETDTYIYIDYDATPLEVIKKVWIHQSAHCDKYMVYHNAMPYSDQGLDRLRMKGVEILKCDCLTSTPV